MIKCAKTILSAKPALGERFLAFFILKPSHPKGVLHFFDYFKSFCNILVVKRNVWNSKLSLPLHGWPVFNITKPLK